MPTRIRIALGLTAAGATFFIAGAALVWLPAGFLSAGVVGLGLGIALGVTD